MKKPLNPVTDHAVVRYLERVKGLDVEALRAEIGGKVALGIAHGASSVVSQGYRYMLSASGHVLTVTRASEPEIRIGSYKRRREIDDG